MHLAIKLKYYGIRGPTLGWINGFLSDRSQRVVLEGQTSNTEQVTSGVPQGSVLGPVLFLLYINDLPNALSSNVRLFADDSIVYREIATQADCDTLQQDLNKLTEWEKTWLMEFNASKCETLTVTRKRLPIVHNYTLHGETLKRVTSTKYLGVTITSDLNWNKHIGTITRGANQTLGFIKRNIKTRSHSVKTRALPGTRSAAFGILRQCLGSKYSVCNSATGDGPETCRQVCPETLPQHQ